MRIRDSRGTGKCTGSGTRRNGGARGISTIHQSGLLVRDRCAKLCDEFDSGRPEALQPGFLGDGGADFAGVDGARPQSRVRQAELKRELAKEELSFAQRKLLAEMRSLYSEAETALNELSGLRKRSAELSAESLRLTTLRYKGGEASVLEVVDAQSTFAQANAAYQNGAVRYRRGAGQSADTDRGNDDSMNVRMKRKTTQWASGGRRCYCRFPPWRCWQDAAAPRRKRLNPWSRSRLRQQSAGRSN